MNKHAVGFIGLGRMGLGMASNLAKAGAPLTVYDARPQAMEACAGLGASVASDAADVASKVESLFLCLPSETEVSDFASEYFVPRILERKFEGDFSLQAAFKDIVNIQEAAARFQATMPVVDAMVSTYQSAIDMGFGDQPKSAMVKVYEQQMDQEVHLHKGRT